jgi:streptogramin lyase
VPTSRIRRTTQSSHVIWTLALIVACLANENIRAAEMQYPLAVAASKGGPIFVADLNYHGIWKIDSGKLESVFEGSKKFRTPLNAVRCVALDKQGRLLAGDSATREVYRFDDGKTPVPLTKGANAGVGIPMAIAVHSSGDIYVADLEIHRIVRIAEGGGQAQEVAEVPAVRGLWFDKEDRLYIQSAGPDHVLRRDKDGKIEPLVKGRPFNFAHHLAVDDAGMVYVADGYEKAIWKFDGEKVSKLVSGEPLVNPVGLTWTGEKLLVADPRANAIFELTTDGKLSKIELLP